MGRFEPNGSVDSIASRFYEQVAIGFDVVGEAAAKVARARAPRRKPSRQRSHTFRVTPRAIGGSGVDVDAMSAEELLAATRAGKVELEPGGRRTVSPQERFQIRRGQVHSIRRTARGVEVRLGGRLKAGIHYIEAIRKGRKVVGRLVSEAPYSLYMDRGFYHRNAKRRVKGTAFFTHATEEARDQLKQASTYRG